MTPHVYSDFSNRYVQLKIFIHCDNEFILSFFTFTSQLFDIKSLYHSQLNYLLDLYDIFLILLKIIHINGLY